MSEDGWIVDKHVSAKALPGEPIYSWVKWDKELVPKSITLKYDPDLKIQKMLNADTGDDKRTDIEGQITLDQRQLQIPGFFGFIASYTRLPEEEKTINFIAEFDFGAETKTLEYSTKITRPILVFKQESYTLNLSNISNIVHTIDCELVNNGSVMPVVIHPFIKTTQTEGLDIKIKKRMIENKDKSLIFVKTNKITVREILVSGKGQGLVDIGFEYNDISGNSYKTPPATLSIQMDVDQSLKVPITENISAIAAATPILKAGS